MDGRNYVLEPLTQREAEFLHLLVEGLSNREIAQALVITPGTVKWYNKQLFSKLGVHSRSQAVDRAREMGLLENTRKASPKEIPQLALPSGIVTFLFTDIEGSTLLWDTIPDAMRLSLERHNTILNKAITAHCGQVYKIIGDAFQDSSEGWVRNALDKQRFRSNTLIFLNSKFLEFYSQWVLTSPFT